MMLRTLIAVGVVAALLGSPALGEPIIFDNRDGEFDWNYTCDPSVCIPDPGTYLDITQTPSQSGESSEFTFQLYWDTSPATPHWDIRGLGQWLLNQPDEQRIATDDEPTLLLGDGGTVEEFYFARELGPGDIVDGELNMRIFAYLWAYNPGNPTPEVTEVIDRPSYIGVSLIRNSQLHYGWILVDSPDKFYLAGNFEPLLWAFETTPDTPIAIPDLSCTGDVDGNTIVGITDFLDLLAAWGPNPGHPADFDGDDFVGINDFLDLLANWGQCPV